MDRHTGHIATSVYRILMYTIMKRDPIEFDERSVAKGYLITFRCYGTWLHGDERGSVDRRYYNRFGTPKIEPDAVKVARKAGQLKYDPFLLGAAERGIVEKAVEEVGDFRGYILYALNVRTNHVHSVVNNSGTPERMMDSFKAYSTKALRAAGRLAADAKPWSRHGSTKYLWTEDHLALAIDYVIKGQGDDLPNFD